MSSRKAVSEAQQTRLSKDRQVIGLRSEMQRGRKTPASDDVSPWRRESMEICKLFKAERSSFFKEGQRIV